MLIPSIKPDGNKKCEVYHHDIVEICLAKQINFKNPFIYIDIQSKSLQT